jgi:hypothetical protein
MSTDARTFHFDFGRLDAASPLTFHQSLRRYEVRAHDDHSRSRARTVEPLLRLIPDARLTHFVDVPDMPAETVLLSYVSRRQMVSGVEVDAPVHMAIHVPREGAAHAAAETKRRRGSAPPRLHPKLSHAGVSLDSLTAMDSNVDPQFPPNVDTFQNAVDAAVALLFHHPNLINLSTDNGGAIPAYIVNTIITGTIESNPELPAVIEGNDNWLVTTTYTGPPPENQPATSSVPNADVQSALTGPLAIALQASQADTFLATQQWNYEYGTTSATYGGAMTGPSPEALMAVDSNGDNWTARTVPGTSTRGFSVDSSSIVVTPPAAGDNWVSTGIWSIADVAPLAPLTDAAVAALIAGELYLQLDGSVTMQAQLVLASAPDASSLTQITATFAPVGIPPGDTPTVTATLTLNSGQTGITYSLSAQGLGTSATAGFYSGSGAGATLLRSIPITDFTGMGSISIQCTNTWLRHLSACVQYLDAAGNILTPPVWSDLVPSWLQATFEPDPTKKFIGLVPPVVTCFGVPLPATPTTLTFPIWEDVSTISILTGGLGRGPYDGGVCPIGITVTALVELVLPPFLLMAGTAIMNSAAIQGIMNDSEVLFAVCSAGAFLVGGPTAAYLMLSQDPGAAATGLTEKFAPMLLSPVTSLGKWVAGKIVEGAGERAALFIDIVLLAVNSCITAAQLSQTIVEVLDSPFVYETSLVASVTLTVTLNPDARFNKFPDDHDHFTVIVVYDAGTTLPSVVLELPATTISDPITVTFQNAPAGGNARAYCFFYAANDWQSGQGVSDWTPVMGTNGVCALSLMVTTNEIPLTVNSVYGHVQKVALQDGALSWQATSAPPTATLDTAPPFGQNMAVQSYGGLTLNQQSEMLGMCYQANGLNLPPNFTTNPPSGDTLYVLENISLLQNPSLGAATSPVGFVASPGTAYNITASNGASAANFFIDSSAGDFTTDNPASGHHVRQIVLSANTAPDFATSSNQSFGRFPLALTRYVYHPQGLIIGINLSTHKLFILDLQSNPSDDADAAQATMASGQGFRDGLIYGPAGLAIALDGRILVLEANNNRIQAFDTTGIAVPYFGDPSAQTVTMTLHSEASSTYLDISVESKGYIYVLYYGGDGSQPGDYAVDIYQPDGTFLVTTPNVAAANMTVDILRNLFTMNYETILDANGRPLPSVSMWMPPPPPPAQEEVVS